MALQRPTPSPLNPQDSLPDAYWRVEAIHIEPTNRTASCLLYGYENEEAAALAKKQIRGEWKDDGDNLDPERLLPPVQTIGQKPFTCKGDDYDAQAKMQQAGCGNVYAAAYEQAKASKEFADSKDV